MANPDKQPGNAPPARGTVVTGSTEAAQALRRLAEETLGQAVAKESKGQAPMSAEEIQVTLHELRVHQIELEMQNEELRRTQVELDRAREEYFNLYDLAPVGYCTISEGLLLKVNLTAAGLLGLARSAMVGKSLSSFILKEDQDIYYLRNKQLFATGTEQVFELRLKKSDGAVFWAQLVATAVVDVDGLFVCRMTISDISALKQAECSLREMLSESKQDFKKLVNSGMALIWTSGTDKLCNYFNSVWLEFTGRTLEEERGNGWTEGVHPDDFQRCLDTYLGAFDRQEKFSMEYRLRRHDGTYRWIVDEGCPRYDSQGEFLGYIGHCLDIDERRRTEDARQTLLAEKEILLKEVHHRVKNNLAAIMGLIDVQGRELTDPAAGKAMTALSTRISAMALVHEQLYRSDNFARIDFQEYLETLISHLRLSHDRTGGDIHISIAAADVAMGLDNAVPCGLFITELVTNAYKYAFPSGLAGDGVGRSEIAVSASWDGTAYSLAVTDNGVGLPKDFDWTKSETLGLMLVGMLGEHQLQGEVELDGSNGTKCRLRFVPKKNNE